MAVARCLESRLRATFVATPKPALVVANQGSGSLRGAIDHGWKRHA